MAEVSEHKKQDFNQLTLKDLIFKYLRYLPLFAFCVGLTLFGAWLYLRYATLVYKAEGTMQIKQEERTTQSDRIEELLQGGNGVTNIQSEIEVLRSVPLMNRVVKKLNLQNEYLGQGKIKESNNYTNSPFIIDFFEVSDSTKSFTLLIDFVDASRFRIDNEQTVFRYGQILKNGKGVFRLNKRYNTIPGVQYKLTWHPPDALSRAFIKSLTVAPKAQGTGSVILSMQSTNSQMSADIVNTLMEEYDIMTIEQSNISNDLMLDFIDDRLQILSKEIDSLNVKVLAYRQENKLFDVEAQTGAYFEKINESDRLIGEQSLLVNVADMVNGYLQDKQNQYSKVVVPSSLGLEDVTLNQLVSEYNLAQQTRQGLLDAQIALGNPAIKEVEGQIELLRKSILENTNNIKRAMLDNIATIQRRSSVAESSLQKLPYKLKEFVEMERLVQTKTALYNLLEGKREEGAISRSATVSSSKIIDKALPNEIPVKPDKLMVLLLCTLIGIGVPAAIIFVKELFNDKVNTRSDVEKLTAVPILGEVGNSGKETLMVVAKNSRSLIAEQFRILRSNLQYFLPNIEKPVIMVTSSFSGEGKSFVCSNMGAVMSLTGKKTVVLEMDIRKPKVMSGLGLKELKRKGLVSYLVGKAEMEELILPVPGYDNFFVLPCGPIPPNPAELLLGNQMKEMFTWLKEHFDYILVDTAPVGMVSDALSIGKYADCTLYVVRQEYTYKKQLEIIDELDRDNKVPHPSIILNDIKTRGGYGYYGSGKYGYGSYGYGSNGYYDEEKDKGLFESMVYYLNPVNWVKRKAD